MTKAKDDVAALWVEFRAKRSQDTRNRLIVNYLHCVRYTAERIHKKLPKSVQLDDLVSAGTFGLMQAIDLYDPARKVKFETYSQSRIFGAIMDELRDMDLIPRLTHTRHKLLTDAIQVLRGSLRREPNDRDLRKYLKVKQAELDRMRNGSHVPQQISITRTRFVTETNREVLEVDTMVDGRHSSPHAKATSNCLRELIMQGLTRAERASIVLYDLEGMNMREIGKVIDLSESRVSQIHTDAMTRITDRMLAMGPRAVLGE